MQHLKQQKLSVTLVMRSYPSCDRAMVFNATFFIIYIYLKKNVSRSRFLLRRRRREQDGKS